MIYGKIAQTVNVFNKMIDDILNTFYKRAHHRAAQTVY